MDRRYLVVDDHPLMREAVRFTLELLEQDCGIDTAVSLAEAQRRLGEGTAYELVLLDLQLPDSRAYEGLQTLKTLRPDCAIVVMSADTDRTTILRCLELGAAGYIPKTLQTDAVMNALRLVVSGCVYVPAEAVTGAMPQDTLIRLKAGGEITDPAVLGLTDRQIDVLRLILRGLPNKLICRQLKLAEGTVKVHVSAVLRALGVRNRTQAVVAAGRLGLRIN